jgi:hypothetical protein
VDAARECVPGGRRGEEGIGERAAELRRGTCRNEDDFRGSEVEVAGEEVKVGVEAVEGPATGSTEFSDVPFTDVLIDSSVLISSRTGVGGFSRTLSSKVDNAESWFGIGNTPAATAESLPTGPPFSLALIGIGTTTPFGGTELGREFIDGSSLLPSVECISRSEYVG